jgi:molecular chaperone IbpA
MVTKYAMDLFNDPFFIGFNRELSRLNTAHQTNSQSYPPYDLLKLDEDTYRLSLAIAGFTKDDLKISVDNGTLIIKGEIVEVTDAEVVHKDGMLHIDIDRIVPEEKKPKEIAIKVAKK